MQIKAIRYLGDEFILPKSSADSLSYHIVTSNPLASLICILHDVK